MTNSQLYVAPFSEIEKNEYDLFIGAVGYESRATHALTQILPQVGSIVAAPFEQNRVLSYGKNLKAFELVGDVIAGDHRYAKELRLFVEDAMTVSERKRFVLGEHFRVCVDVSSMTRARVAETMLVLCAELVRTVEVHWVYSPARYSRGLMNTGAVKFNDAILGFEGWADPLMPLHAVVGLGLEGDLALGVLDDLEVTETSVFEPGGFHLDYDRKIMKRNANFIRGVAADNYYTYNVIQPYSSFLKLSAVVRALTVDRRVVLLPLGPKIFAVMCLILGMGDRQRVTVWRLSADAGAKPIDRQASGPILGLSTKVHFDS